MTAERSNRALALYLAACALPEPERARYIEQNCDGDDELRRRVESLLAEGAGSIGNGGAPSAPKSEGPGAAQGARLSDPDRLPERIGPYQVLSVLGEGGFGVVYLAERREPMVQRVAIKVIRPGMDSKTVLARFDQERQALAVMDHPNVARVLDAGTTDRGLPYFVMEHVKGEPIIVYCDLHNLGVKQRLGLFVQVCEAVQHAHTKGVIHRDLKPGNILVADGDSGPIPKVIDFGVAKAIEQTLAQHTVFTEQGQFVGTPEYMSPEQAEMGATDIDTRTDVYSLGVVLYRLLTGSLPFDSEPLRSGGYDEMRRIIREVEPPSPSKRLAGPGQRGARVSTGLPTSTLARLLKNELEWIPLKAMRKDREQRYRTPLDMADDIRNYLEGRPLSAGPESAGYRLRKFVQRRRGPVIAGALVSGALLLGAVGTGVGLVKARAEARLALEATARAQGAEAAERERADQLEQVSAFQSSQLRGIDAAQMALRLGTDLVAEARAAMERAGLAEEEIVRRTALIRESLPDANLTNVALKTLDRTIFDRALAAVDEQFQAQPLVRAALLQTLADTLRDLGLLDRAAAPQAGALEIRRRLLGAAHPETLASVAGTGLLLKEQGKSSEAEPYLREVLAAASRSGSQSAERVEADTNLGLLLEEQGKVEEAEAYLVEAMEMSRRILGPDHTLTTTAVNNMGLLRRAQGRLSEAEPYFREALETRRRVLGGEHADTLVSINNMGFLLQAQRRLAEAEPYLREALETQRRILGDDHPHTLMSISNVGFVLQAQGRLSEAEPLQREVIERARRVLGPDHPTTIVMINNLGVVLQKQAKLDAAEPLLREALEKLRRLVGPEHPDTLAAMHSMGGLLRALGRLPEAEAHAREAAAGMSRTLGENRWETANARMGLGAVQIALGRYAEAEENLLAAERAFLSAQGVPPSLPKKNLELLGALYEAWEKAEPGKGYGVKAAERRVGADALGAPPVR